MRAVNALARLRRRTGSSESTILEDTISTKISRIVIFFLSFSYSMTSDDGAISRLRGRMGSSESTILENTISTKIS